MQPNNHPDLTAIVNDLIKAQQPPALVIFAPVFPLVKMMWRDGVIQTEEIDIFVDHVWDYVHQLPAVDWPCIKGVSIKELLLYFASRAIEDVQFAQLIDQLSESHHIFELEGLDHAEIKAETLSTAIDIAAAAVVYTDAQWVRVTAEEKTYMRKLVLLVEGVDEIPVLS